MTALTWTLAALSLLGVVLNIARRRACFAIWTATNAAWAAVDLAAGLPAQAALMASYCALSIWGLWSWRPQRTSSAPTARTG